MPGRPSRRGPGSPPLVIVIMGVSSSGKTTVGAMLAARLCWRFADADDFHSAGNIAKMGSGRPLDDADRMPWLRAIAEQIDRWRAGRQHAVVTCSALKRSYREVIIGNRPDVRLVYLKGERALIEERLAARHGHFMPITLLDSQFQTLEEPDLEENAITVWIGRPPAALVDDILGALADEAALGAYSRRVSNARQREVEVFSDVRAMTRAQAERIVARAREAIAARGRFLLALCGGSTPRPLYELLAAPPLSERIDWARVHVFWGDERCVPPDHAESNYRMAREALLDRVPLPATNVHRIRGEDEPEEAARAYERLLRTFFRGDGGAPRRSFDLVLLGMGRDGHTASLFPSGEEVQERRRWVVASHATRPIPMWRVTLTPIVLNAATDVTFLVVGEDKAARLHQVLEGGVAGAKLPAQIIRPTHGALHWMVDAAAAAQLEMQYVREAPRGGIR